MGDSPGVLRGRGSSGGGGDKETVGGMKWDGTLGWPGVADVAVILLDSMGCVVNEVEDRELSGSSNELMLTNHFPISQS